MKKSIFWLKKLAKAATGEARIHRDDTYTEGTCKYCNAVLVHHRMAKKKIFCSQRCRLAWWAIEHKKPVKCKWCRKEISQVPGKKEKKFCSDRCRSKWWSRHVDKGNRKAQVMRLLASIVRLYSPHTEIRIGSIAVMSAT